MAGFVAEAPPAYLAKCAAANETRCGVGAIAVPFVGLTARSRLCFRRFSHDRARPQHCHGCKDKRRFRNRPRKTVARATGIPPERGSTGRFLAPGASYSSPAGLSNCRPSGSPVRSNAPFVASLCASGGHFFGTVWRLADGRAAGVAEIQPRDAQKHHSGRMRRPRIAATASQSASPRRGGVRCCGSGRFVPCCTLCGLRGIH